MKVEGLRFIVGNGCNYDCFYCHHEGYFKKDNYRTDKEKLKLLKEFTIKNNIKNISITGGEPFMYFDNTYQILQEFDDYNKTMNSNFSLADKYYNQMKELKPLELHINLSSLNSDIHQSIIKKEYLKQVLNNLELYKSTNHKICLNIVALKTYNDKELLRLYKYAIENNFTPRFLVFMPTNEEQKKYVMTIEDIMNMINARVIINKYGYGIYKVKTGESEVDILKCLCDDRECEICRKVTYMHITPDLNIKYCLQKNDVVKINYESVETIEESFKEASKRLELIK